MVLALGGGLSLYFQQKKNGSVPKWLMENVAEISSFVRARQEVCHSARPVAQIGLFYSKEAIYKKSTTVLFGNWEDIYGGNGEIDHVHGILRTMLAGQHCVNVVMEHNLESEEDMAKYPVLVIPEWTDIDPAMKERFVSYAENGGKLLIIGPHAAKHFKDELGISIIQQEDCCDKWLGYKGNMASIKTDCCTIVPNEGTQTLGELYGENDMETEAQPAASIKERGRGKIAALYFNFGQYITKNRNSLMRDFLSEVIDTLFPKPIVKLKGSHLVDVSVMTKKGKLIVNLVNTAGPHDNYDVYSFDEIPAIGPLDITIQTETVPQKVRAVPGDTAVEYGYKNGCISLTRARLEIHSAIVIE